MAIRHRASITGTALSPGSLSLIAAQNGSMPTFNSFAAATAAGGRVTGSGQLESASILQVSDEVGVRGMSKALDMRSRIRLCSPSISWSEWKSVRWRCLGNMVGRLYTGIEPLGVLTILTNFTGVMSVPKIETGIEAVFATEGVVDSGTDSPV